MPRVPILDVPRASPRAMPTPYSNLDVRSGMDDVARGLGQLGAGIERMEAAKAAAQKKADDYRVDEADLAYGKHLNDGLYSKERGFLNQRGERALDVGPTLQALEKAEADIAKGLSNDEQRRRFSIRARTRAQQALATMEKHSAGERLQVFRGIAEGQRDLALEDAARDPDTAAVAAGKLLVGPEGEPGPLRRYLDQQGLPAEQRKAAEHRVLGEVYGAAIEGALAKETPEGLEKAEAIFAKARPVLGKSADNYEKKLQSRRREVASVQLASAAVEAATDGKGQVDLTLASAYVAKGAEGDAKLEGSALDIVKEKHGMAAAARRQKGQELERQAREAAASGMKHLARYEEAMRAHSEETSHYYDGLKDRLLLKARQWAGDKAATAEQRKRDADAIRAYTNLHPNLRANEDPQRWADSFGASDAAVKQMTSLHRTAEEQVKLGVAESRSAFVTAAKLEGQAMFKRKKASKEEQDKFEAAAGTAWDQHFAKHGAPSLVDGAKLRAMVVESWTLGHGAVKFEGPDRPTREQLQQSQGGGAVPAGGISDEQIRAKLQSRGIKNPTEEQIRAVRAQLPKAKP